MGERERHRDRGGVRDDKKDHRKSTGDHKNDNASNHEEFREHAESLTAGRDSGASRLKETYKSYKSSSRESNAQKEDRMQKRKHDDQERDSSSPSPGEKISRSDQYQGKATRVNENHDSNAKKVEGTSFRVQTRPLIILKMPSRFTKISSAGKSPSSSNDVQVTV
eukprot:TRINITY_DN33327_c0_g1_i12.p2 TRINITY_DN33327_c0_g1~~TRINITY_DN33327_c0_g1_i12.p2  ORF type:complete len:165 (+),score=37.61 TRINITY_DN33327_c0_g1_i12:699-1193(+)